MLDAVARLSSCVPRRYEENRDPRRTSKGPGFSLLFFTLHATVYLSWFTTTPERPESVHSPLVGSGLSVNRGERKSNMKKIIISSIAGIALATSGLALAATASAAPTCTRTDTSITCIGTDGSFYAAHTPASLTIDENGNPVFTHRTVDVDVTVGKGSVSFSRDENNVRTASVSLGSRTVTVTDTAHDGNLPKVTVTKDN